MAVSRRSLVIAALSTVVEWYDFTLYLYLSTVLARVFFGAYETSLLATLGGFAVAYLMRPLGAIAFGHIGDRIGRRSAMLWSMMTMSLAMLATALLPSHAQIGPLAAWLLLALRCIMGFSVGGEYTGVVAYLLESASARHRGLIASCASAASEIGALCAVTVSALTVHLATPAALDAWAWRVPFFVGAGLAGAVWAARASMQESPEFERQREAHSIPAFPLGHALRHHRAGILRGFAISALGSITYYVGITYVPAFLSSSGGRTEAFSLWLATLAALCVILVTPLVGIWSDRIGRKRVLLVFCLAAGVLPMMLFSMMAGSQPLQTLLGALVLAAIAGGVSAVGAVATAEQFPGEARLTGLALGATTATAVFGGFTPYLAQLWIARTGWNLAPGALIAIVAVAVLPILIRAPETAPCARRAPLPSSSINA